MTILGIETSCDETSASVIQVNIKNKSLKMLSNIVASSLNLHSKTGGIIPEIAAREQVKYIIPVIKKALMSIMSTPRVDTQTIDAIAVTVGPGLIGSLLVGVETAKTLAYVWKKPIIPVNHLIGHIYANFIKDDKSSASMSLRAKRSEARQSQMVGIASSPASPDPRNDNITFPALALIVSGGHTDLVLMKKHGSIRWLGGTRDDAAGEAFDKIGRLLGLPYPGGPAIEKVSERGDASHFTFPRPMIDSDDFDFSFSGLKTAVFRKVKTMKQLNNETIADLAASVQQAIIDVLVAKTLKAAQKYKAKSILLGGGVAANQTLRNEFIIKLQTHNPKLITNFFAPAKKLCTDNGAMIGSAAFFNYKPVSWKRITANPELYFD